MRFIMAEKYTEAQKKATYKYVQSQDRIEIKLPKGSRERIKNHAEKMGESVTGFISRAINETIENDTK